MADEIRETFSADLSRLEGDAKKAEALAERAERRVGSVQARARVAERDINATIDRIERRLARRAKNAVAHYAITAGIQGLTESLDLPEATQPLVNIGFAAAQGAQFGGAIGAAAMAALSIAQELVKAMKKRKDDIEALQKFFEAERAERRKAEREVLIRQREAIAAQNEQLREFQRRLAEETENELYQTALGLSQEAF